MPKKRKFEIVRCVHFTWRLVFRAGVWYGDGRSNSPSAGRHSTGTSDRSEALRLLPQLDLARAIDLGLVKALPQGKSTSRPLPLQEGRELYEQHIARPRVAGGVRPATRKRYRSPLDKFLRFAHARGVTVWNGVSAQLLLQYAAYLNENGFAHKTQHTELVTLKQTVKWLITEGHLPGVDPIQLKLRKAESKRAYCWTPEEVKTMIEYAHNNEPLRWLGDVMVALATTGLRIAELVSLRWADVNLTTKRLELTDETAHPIGPGLERRQLKSGRGRSFPINMALLGILERLPRVGKYVFYGPRGGRLKPDTVRRILIRDVINPLSKRFPSSGEEDGFRNGRLHSFRHYFCSMCANNRVPERMLMDWLGHCDSSMVVHYYHLHDSTSRRQMDRLDFLGGSDGRSADADE